MTTQASSRRQVQFNTNVDVFTWTLNAGDDGAPVEMAISADRTIHFSGVFDGATVVLEGSNLPLTPTPTYAPLTDPQGNAISKTAESIEAVTELTALVRPRVIGGAGGTAIVASLLIKR